MVVRVRRRGPASKYEMWARCRDPERWTEWLGASGVRASGPLVPGTDGVVLTRIGLTVPFEVIDVDEPGGRWIRSISVGPFRLRLEHEIAEGLAGVVVSAPAPVALAYVPIARRTMRRLAAAQSPPVT
jgi:hypothetical protein